MKEIWKPVVGFEGFYEISDFGRVKSVARTVENLSRWGSLKKYTVREKIRKQRCHRGYLYVDLIRDAVFTTKIIHSLVLEAFVGPRPDGMEARHLDGDSSNNCLSNLDWGTHAENERDKIAHGTHRRSDDGRYARA